MNPRQSTRTPTTAPRSPSLAPSPPSRPVTLLGLIAAALIAACAQSEAPAQSGGSGAFDASRPEKLRASDPRRGAFFGGALAADGGTLLVGARGHDEAGSRAGAAYLFERRRGGWRESARLRPDDTAPDDHFGYAVDIDGAYALVGAPRHDSGGADLGAVYLYRRENGTWRLDDRWSPSGGDVGTGFGSRVAIDGDRAVVALAKDRRNLVQPDRRRTAQTRGQGSAIVFERGPDGWIEVDRLVPDRLHDDLIDAFGSALDLSADTIVVGAKAADTPAGRDAGAVHLFTAAAGAAPGYVPGAVLSPSTAGAKQNFGACVAIDGDRLVVGANGGSNSLTDSGEAARRPPVAFVFERRGELWEETAALTPAGGDRFDAAGCPVAIHGDELLVGAPADDSVQRNQGAVYLFERSDDAGWHQVAKIVQTDEVTTEGFGGAVALSADALFAGASRDVAEQGTAVGSVYAYER